MTVLNFSLPLQSLLKPTGRKYFRGCVQVQSTLGGAGTVCQATDTPEATLSPIGSTHCRAMCSQYAQLYSYLFLKTMKIL